MISNETHIRRERKTYNKRTGIEVVQKKLNYRHIQRHNTKCYLAKYVPVLILKFKLKKKKKKWKWREFFKLLLLLLLFLSLLLSISWNSFYESYLAFKLIFSLINIMINFPTKGRRWVLFQVSLLSFISVKFRQATNRAWTQNVNSSFVEWSYALTITTTLLFKICYTYFTA